MITSKQIIGLSEEWFKNVHGFKNQSVPIYINPDSSDLRELIKSVKETDFHNLIRFVADAKTRKVYVADGGLILHANLTLAIGFSRLEMENFPYCCLGYGTLSGGKIRFDSKDNEEFKLFNTFRSLRVASDTLRLIKKSNNFNRPVDKWQRNLIQSYNWINSFFTFNWTFLEKYIIGFSSYFNQEKTKFESWKQENIDLL